MGFFWFRKSMRTCFHWFFNCIDCWAPSSATLCVCTCRTGWGLQPCPCGWSCIAASCLQAAAGLFEADRKLNAPKEQANWTRKSDLIKTSSFLSVTYRTCPLKAHTHTHTYFSVLKNAEQAPPDFVPTTRAPQLKPPRRSPGEHSAHFGFCCYS